MIYLDNGATSFPKPEAVIRAVEAAVTKTGNPGRGGYPAAMAAAKTLYRCREMAGEMFACGPEQVVLTANCTQGLNMAIRTLVKPGDRVVVSGFEHNAVTRPLHLLGAEVIPAGRKLFDWADTLAAWEDALKTKPKAAVFTHVSNVFGYILPVAQIAALCRDRGVPFIVDAAQSAGILPVSLKELGADFIAMPGHKGLLGPTGTGLLLCGRTPEVWMAGGTGSDSIRQEMPDFLPDRAEAGTANVPGAAGLAAGMAAVRRLGMENIAAREASEARRCAQGLRKLGLEVFAGDHQAGTVSVRGDMDCEAMADALGRRGIATRAGLHCAPLAHESAGTLDTGTLRISFGHNANRGQSETLLRIMRRLPAQGIGNGKI